MEKVSFEFTFNFVSLWQLLLFTLQFSCIVSSSIEKNITYKWTTALITDLNSIFFLMTLIMEMYWIDVQAIFSSVLPQYSVILLILVCCFVKNTSSETSEETTVWIAFLLSGIERFLSSPKKWTKSFHKEWIFIYWIGPSRSGKSHLIDNLVVVGIFPPKFGQIYYSF